MDNQQRKVEELAWLAGFFDGEGSIHFRKTTGQRLKGMKLEYQYPNMRICGTHEGTLEVIGEILRQNDLPFHVSRRFPTSDKHAPSWDIECKGMKRCKRWLETLLPYLKTKYEQAVLMLEFIDLRLSDIDYSGRGYSDREQEIIEQLRKRVPPRAHRLNAYQL